MRSIWLSNDHGMVYYMGGFLLCLSHHSEAYMYKMMASNTTKGKELLRSNT